MKKFLILISVLAFLAFPARGDQRLAANGNVVSVASNVPFTGFQSGIPQNYLFSVSANTSLTVFISNTTSTAATIQINLQCTGNPSVVDFSSNDANGNPNANQWVPIQFNTGGAGSAGFTTGFHTVSLTSQTWFATTGQLPCAQILVQLQTGSGIGALLTANVILSPQGSLQAISTTGVSPAMPGTQTPPGNIPGNAFVAGTPVQVVAGTDGTNTRTLRTDGFGAPQVSLGDTAQGSSNAASVAGGVAGATTSFSQVSGSSSNNTLAVTQFPAGTPTHITTLASTVVKASAGILYSIIVNSAGSAMTVQVGNGASCPGTIVAGPSAAVTAGQTFTFNMAMSAGICVVTAGTTAGDLTVVSN